MGRHGRGICFPLGLVGVLAAFPAGTTRASAQHTEHGAEARPPAKPSSALRVVTSGGEINVSLRALDALPQTTVTVHNAHSNADERYAGPTLSDVLAKAGAPLGKETLHGYVVATGTDGYWVLYSGEEISGTVHAGVVLVATRRDGHPLTEDGQIKLVSTEDKKPERWVRNLEVVQWKEAAR